MPKRGRKAILSIVIDPLLFEGGRQVSEMATLLFDKFQGKYKKEKLINNIRSRIFIFLDRGYKLEKEAVRKVRIVPVDNLVPATVENENVEQSQETDPPVMETEKQKSR